ncbi:magnesium transporter CorA family protein [Dermatophilaceae bacterium Soc4.6]
MEDQGGDAGPVRGRVWRAGVLERTEFAFDAIDDLLAEPDVLVWVDVCDPSSRVLDDLAVELSLDPLAVEDAVSHGERAKVTRYSSHIFLTAYAAVIASNPSDPSSPSGASGRPNLRLSRVSAFVLPRGIVTVHASDGFDMDEVVSRWDENADLLKHGVGALVHGLLDMVVDSHFEAVQVLDDRIEALEDVLFEEESLSHAVQRQTYGIRKDLVALRRVVLPMREVVNGVLRHRQERGAPTELNPWYDDLYDHVLRATEWTESLRDMVTTIFETNLSLQDARLNTVMKKLTSWAAIIAIPTAITGFFGQNVPYPGFQQPFGFELSTVSIIVIAGLLYLTFKRRGWL